MSDRHIVQKIFNQMFQDFCSGIMLNVIRSLGDQESMILFVFAFFLTKLK